MWGQKDLQTPVNSQCGAHRRILLCAAMLGLFGVANGMNARPAGGDVASKSATAAHSAADAAALADLTTTLTDLQATMHMQKCDKNELEKIGGDFARSYQFQGLFRTVTLEYKQPDKLRLSGKGLLGKASIVMNGPLRFSRVPLMPKKVEDLSDSPGKRQSILEYGGLLAPETLTFMQGKFVREETVDDQPTSVFDLTYKGAATGSHYRVWFDTKTRLTTKREWYGLEGKLKATFYYQNPKEIANGIWLPTQVEVKNAEGVSAAITTLDDVKVNQGLSDELFAIPR